MCMCINTVYIYMYIYVPKWLATEYMYICAKMAGYGIYVLCHHFISAVWDNPSGSDKGVYVRTPLNKVVGTNPRTKTNVYMWYIVYIYDTRVYPVIHGRWNNPSDRDKHVYVQ